MTVGDDILDDLFQGAALAAYLEVWRQTGQFPPDREATRQLAYRLYEEALAEKNRRKGPRSGSRPPKREASQDWEASEGAAIAPLESL